MALTWQQVSSQVYFVHMLAQSFMKNYNIRTTTFMKPAEYSESPNGCVGLFAFGTIIIAVMPDGSIKELTPVCPQMMIDLIERNFKKMLVPVA